LQVSELALPPSPQPLPSILALVKLLRCLPAVSLEWNVVAEGEGEGHILESVCVASLSSSLSGLAMARPPAQMLPGSPPWGLAQRQQVLVVVMVGVALQQLSTATLA
jgi:hypothetical protein